MTGHKVTWHLDLWQVDIVTWDGGTDPGHREGGIEVALELSVQEDSGILGGGRPDWPAWNPVTRVVGRLLLLLFLVVH